MMQHINGKTCTISFLHGFLSCVLLCLLWECERRSDGSASSGSDHGSGSKKRERDKLRRPIGEKTDLEQKYSPQSVQYFRHRYTVKRVLMEAGVAGRDVFEAMDLVSKDSTVKQQFAYKGKSNYDFSPEQVRSLSFYRLYQTFLSKLIHSIAHDLCACARVEL